MVRFYSAGLLDPGSGYMAKFILLIGLAYPFGPIDLIPNRIPVIGYVDQIAFVIGGIALSYLALPRQSAPATTARTGTARMQWAKRVRAALLDGFAMALATPILRLSTGKWPAPADTASFRRAFRHFTPLPPLMRGLASVPAGREQLTRAMLAGWLLADDTYRGSLMGELTGGDTRPGNALRVWSGPPVTFLHLEKTAGMSIVAALAAQFHPLQIDADLRRAFPPHVLCPLPPFLLARVRRCALVWGHYDLPSIRRLGPGRFTFTLLRDPEARIVSLYRYWRGQAALDLGWNGMNAPVLAAQRLSLAEFLATDDPVIRDYIDNFYVRRLTGQYASLNAVDPLAADPQYWLDQALAALDTLDFVGLTEDSGWRAECARRAAGLCRPRPCAAGKCDGRCGGGCAAERSGRRVLGRHRRGRGGPGPAAAHQPGPAYLRGGGAALRCGTGRRTARNAPTTTHRERNRPRWYLTRTGPAPIAPRSCRERGRAFGVRSRHACVRGLPVQQA